uniref:Uncharacterized protein n=1 Tax=viral metagenome TaxID=1070528 RepID=A0A6C0D7A8_9ZZZZ
MSKNTILKNWFLEWQNEEICSYKFGYMPRKHAITKFIKEGYIPLISRNGYVFSKNIEILENTIASMLFFYHIDKFYDYNIPINNNYDEHWYHFNFKIPYENWYSFLNYWNDILDDLFANCASQLFGCLIVLAYQYINLEKSSTYLQYLEDNYSNSDDEQSKKEKNIDPYILDQMNKYTSFKNSRKEE